MLNLDTHILIYALSGDLSAKERRVLEGSTWGISGVVLWELTKLSQLDRIEIDINSRKIKKVLSEIPLFPIDLQVCQAMAQLDFSSDPADEIIAATSLAKDLPLVTRDKRIRSSKLVPFV